jgi:Fe-S-cluster-containing dehydrogenase component
MARFGMVIDTRKCVGCQDCVVACQTENDVPQGYCRDWITTEVRGTFPQLTMEIRTERCNHCDNPPCVSCCPTGASHVEEFGQTVQVTANKCIGCKACIASCPYDARFVHPKGYVDKCTFCLHRVKEGKDPACVSVCPTHCMSSATWTTPRARSTSVAGHAQAPLAAARSRHQAAHLLPDLRSSRHARNHLDKTQPLIDPHLTRRGAGRSRCTCLSAASSPA